MPRRRVAFNYQPDYFHIRHMSNNKRTIQLIWGALLFLMGIGVFYRIPQVMPDIEKIEQFAPMTMYIRFCFYLIAILLIGGGVKKIHTHYKHKR